MKLLGKVLGSLRDFLNGAGLPVCLLAVASVYEVFLLAVIFAPAGSGPWSRFSEEFKVWCFSYNPATGGMRWGTVWLMIFEPFVLALITIYFYRKALWEHRFFGAFRVHWRATLFGGVFSAIALMVLTTFSSPSPADALALPFPGERIRTKLEPPTIRLVDQDGVAVDLAAMRGRVVLITGVYATCSTACPQILQTAKRVMDGIPEDEREKFVTLAISLDPENDASWMMKSVADMYFPAATFHYLNGDIQNIRDILERMGFAAIRNSETGAIDHANLFILVDKGGRIAYRFGLDPKNEAWMNEAVAQLLAESVEAKTLAEGNSL